MDKRPLGNSGFSVAPLALGCNVFGWTADEATSHAILDRFVDAGFSLVDTANTYSTWVPRPQGRRVRDDHRQLAEEERQARPRRPRHQGRHADRG
jgi:aryl-alcohol dehydrogenase-like predicted oxidoreductase